MTRAYSYIRFSTKPQKWGASYKRQFELTVAYCERKGLAFSEDLCIKDLGVSGFNGNNADVGALAAFRQAVEDGKVPRGSVLVIENLDRLTRDVLSKALSLFLELLKAGLTIVTLDPEREYTEASINTDLDLMWVILELGRGHRESARKSGIMRDNWDRKRAKAPAKPLTRQCPAWLRPKEDGSGFEPIKQAVATVLRIYDLAREGFGIGQIVRKLTEERVSPIGRRPYWVRNYVALLLKTRAVLGEYQPRLRRDGKRSIAGPPVKNYYPPIMSEKDWRAARRAVTSRQTQRGPRGKNVRNLFTGILFDARDGCTMKVKQHQPGYPITYLVSSGKRDGRTLGDSPAFPYPSFEQNFLCVFDKKETAELLRKGPKGREREIETLAGELEDINNRLRRYLRDLETSPKYETVLQAVKNLEEKKQATAEALDALRGEQAHSPTETLGELRHLNAELQRCPPEELADMRTRLKARIRDLVQEAWVLIGGQRSNKWAAVQVFFRNGKRIDCLLGKVRTGPVYNFRFLHNPGEDPEGFEDLRQWRHNAKEGTLPDWAQCFMRGVERIRAELEKEAKGRARPKKG